MSGQDIDAISFTIQCYQPTLCFFAKLGFKNFDLLHFFVAKYTKYQYNVTLKMDEDSLCQCI